MAEKNAFFESTLVQDFNRDIEQYHLGPLWNAIPDLMKHTPEPHARAYLWKAELLSKKLTEATQIFAPDRGGRTPGYLSAKPWFKLPPALGMGLNDTNALCSRPVNSAGGNRPFTPACPKCSAFRYGRRRCLLHCSR